MSESREQATFDFLRKWTDGPGVATHVYDWLVAHGWRPPEPAEPPKPVDPRCSGTLGKRPSWMGVDQYDPCRCRLDTGHDGPHWCEHLDEPDPRLAVPVSAPEAPNPRTKDATT